MKLLRFTFAQVNILLHKKGFAITLSVILFYVLTTFLYYVEISRGRSSTELYSAAFLYPGREDVKYAAFLKLLFPFLVPLTGAFSILSDLQSRMIPVFRARLSSLQYIVSKLTACFIATFLAFFIPLLIGLVLNLLSFPLWSNVPLSNFGAYTDENLRTIKRYLFPALYIESPYGYVLLYLFLLPAFAGILATFLCSFSLCFRKHKISLFFPLVVMTFVFQILDSIIPFVQLNYLNYLFAADPSPNKNIFVLLLYLFILLLTTTLLASRKIKEDCLC